MGDQGERGRYRHDGGAPADPRPARWPRAGRRPRGVPGGGRTPLRPPPGGARPAALVDCMNFGNPEHPEVMWQLSEAVDGMGEACRALSIPVVGGNVSFYNESRGRDIDPTPVVAVVGIIESLDRRPPGAVLVAGGRLVMLGEPSTALGGSRW